MTISTYESSLHAFANGEVLADVYSVSITRTADAFTMILRALKDKAIDTADVYPFATGDEVVVKAMWTESGEVIEARVVCGQIAVGFDVRDVPSNQKFALPYVEAVLVTREQPLPDWH